MINLQNKTIGEIAGYWHKRFESANLKRKKAKAIAKKLSAFSKELLDILELSEVINHNLYRRLIIRSKEAEHERKVKRIWRFLFGVLVIMFLWFLENN